jgi:AraC-like DNA-binding protein
MKAMLEQVVLKPSSIVAFGFRSMKGCYPYHYHPEIELTLIRQGNGQRMVGDHLGDYQAGDLVLIGSDLPHMYFPSGDAIVVQFHPELGGGVLQQMEECHSFRSLFSRARRGLAFGSRHHRKFKPLLQTLLHATGPRRLILLLEILDLLANDSQAEPLASPGYRPKINSDQAQRIERVCNWITEHLRDTLTLENAAQQIHMTPSAFSRFFHRTTNRPFVRFVNEVRIGQASRLLLETDKSIAEIAFASGFENLSNFNRRFRELRGKTPRDYRATASAFENATAP